MPFCSHCGNPVAPTDAFCANCGGRQPAAPPAPALSSLSPRTAAILCYIPFAGWIAAVVVLATDRFRNDRILRFHAFQGLYLFVAWLLADHVFEQVFRAMRMHWLNALLKLAVIGGHVFMMVKASRDEAYSLPILGELAERSVSERVL